MAKNWRCFLRSQHHEPRRCLQAMVFNHLLRQNQRLSYKRKRHFRKNRSSSWKSQTLIDLNIYLKIIGKFIESHPLPYDPSIKLPKKSTNIHFDRFIEDLRNGRKFCWKIIVLLFDLFEIVLYPNGWIDNPFLCFQKGLFHGGEFLACYLYCFLILLINVFLCRSLADLELLGITLLGGNREALTALLFLFWFLKDKC